MRTALWVEPAAGTTTSNGFDHHNPLYNHLNNGCNRHYLYSYTNAQGRAAMSLPITAAMSKGLVSVVARTQSASVNRTTTSSFRIY